jgi:hypothetical protein
VSAAASAAVSVRQGLFFEWGVFFESIAQLLAIRALTLHFIFSSLGRAYSPRRRV